MTIAEERMRASRTLDRDQTAAFADELRAIRQDGHWSLERFAEFCDIDHTQLSRVENGRRTPTRWFVKQIADAVYPGADPNAVNNRACLYLAAGYAAPELVAQRGQCAQLSAALAILASDACPAWGRVALADMFDSLKSITYVVEHDMPPYTDASGPDQSSGWRQMTVDENVDDANRKETQG